MSLRRIWLLTQQSLGAAVHLRLSWVLSLAGLAFVAGLSVLREFNFGVEEARFFRDFTDCVLVFFGTTLAILLTVALVHGGLEGGMAALLFSRGVRRVEWLLACLLAVVVSVAWLALGMHLLLGLALWRGAHVVSVGDLAAACGRDVLRLGLVACFSLATSALSRTALLATVLAFALTVAAQLAPVIDWATGHAGLAASGAWWLLARMVPDFAALDFPTGAIRAAGYAAGYGILYALLAWAAFCRREI